MVPQNGHLFVTHLPFGRRPHFGIVSCDTPSGNRLRRQMTTFILRTTNLVTEPDENLFSDSLDISRLNRNEDQASAWRANSTRSTIRDSGGRDSAVRDAQTSCPNRSRMQ